jgi:hypothetical protein
MQSITQRELNRTLLSRQMLLGQAAVSAAQAMERVVALQAQVSSPPYFGLWSRVSGFEAAELMRLRDEQLVVRAPLLRSTLHWVAASDYAWIRPVIQPALERAWQGFFGVRKSGIEIEPVCALAKEVLKQGPISLSALSDQLVAAFPHWNKEAMEYGVRTHLPLVQVSPAGAWKGGTAAKYRLVKVAAKLDPSRLVRRYLAAFGPATAKDIAAWAGFAAIGKTLETMRGELVEYQDEGGRTLFDLPGLEIVDGNTPAPVRFVAEYDNLVLSHADRTRVLPEPHRKRVLLTAGRVMATVLIDGFVGGVWKIEREKKVARLRVELFAEPSKKLRREIEVAAELLMEFAEPDSPQREVEVRWIV